MTNRATSWQDEGRINQKRRTREAILAAAAELLARGQRPTVAEVADAAHVSRATAYRYFPTQEYLYSEAALNSIPEEVDAALAAAVPTDAAEMRLDAVVQAMQERTVRHEEGFRTLLRLSLGQAPEADIGQEGQDANDGAEGPTLRRRGGRRMEWIEQALHPIWAHLDAPTQEHLLGALSLCMGIEALVVLRDVCGHTPQQAIEISRWTAQAILRGALDSGSARGGVAGAGAEQTSEISRLRP